MYFGLLITLVISGLVFYSTFYFQVWQAAKPNVISDVPFHTEFIIRFAREHQFPAYSIWYGLVFLVSGLSENYMHLAYTTIVLLALFVSAKYLITYRILSVDNPDAKIATLISLGLVFVMPVISYYSCDKGAAGSYCITSLHVYLGNIAPNQWHNSTLILAMPFNLLLFYFSVRNIQSRQMLPFLVMGILSVISILCKPNYALAFLPVLCIAILVLNAKPQQYLLALAKCCLVAVPSLLTLIYQWYFTFVHNDVLTPGAKTIVAPFFVWSNYSPHIPLSLLLSIAFPLLVLVFFFRKMDIYLKLSWIIFLVALAITITFSEYPNWGAANYFWGSIAANYILFLFSVALLLKQPIHWKSKLSYAVFGVHVLSGCLLLAGFVAGGLLIGKTSLMF